jgi:uncharacterized protein (DUF924 family)
MDEARQIREFWFGKLPLTAQALGQRLSLWFPDDERADVARNWDQAIRSRFGTLTERAALGELASWAHSPRRCLSLILLLDQFPRNIYRGTARAFAGDDQALAVTLSGMESAADAALDVVERLFFYMPLQHSEAREIQDESVAGYRRLVAEAPQELRSAFEDALKYAEQHRSVIERFGRFPHRNRALQRVSTPEEVTWLRGEDQPLG